MSLSADSDEFKAATAVPARFDALVPHDDTPISVFLGMSPPRVDANTIVTFSLLPPDQLPLNPALIPVPKGAIQLCTSLGNQWEAMSRSLSMEVKGIARRLPLWLPILWRKLLQVASAFVKWQSASFWFVRHVRNAEPSHLFEHLEPSLVHFFSTVGWNALVHTPKSSFRSIVLVELFTQDWLSGLVLDHIMDMFHSWSTEYPSNAGVLVDTLDFQTPFLSCMIDVVQCDQFDGDQPGQLSHLQNMARLVRSGNSTTIVCPIHDSTHNHYVCARLDTRSGQLFIGDSLAANPVHAIEPDTLRGFKLFSRQLGVELQPTVLALFDSGRHLFLWGCCLEHCGAGNLPTCSALEPFYKTSRARRVCPATCGPARQSISAGMLIIHFSSIRDIDGPIDRLGAKLRHYSRPSRWPSTHWFLSITTFWIITVTSATPFR